MTTIKTMCSILGLSLQYHRQDLMLTAHSHHMLTLLLDNKLFLAPIGPSPQHVLDIGTGTGIWAMYNSSISLPCCLPNVVARCVLPQADILAVTLVMNTRQPLSPERICPQSSRLGSAKRKIRNRRRSSRMDLASRSL
jgi:hypothetical protein